jgi:hypothetical protein
MSLQYTPNIYFKFRCSFELSIEVVLCFHALIDAGVVHVVEL